MKKENKKLAQEQRARARKKQIMKERLGIIAKFGLPSLAIILLIVFLIVDPFTTSNSNENNNTNTTPTTLATDKSLTVKDGDTVNIDYVGYIDGVAFEGGDTKGNGASLTIGSHSYIDDFEEQLIGHHPGDSVDVNVTFPENYGKDDLNGKDALFKVVINGIYK